MFPLLTILSSMAATPENLKWEVRYAGVLAGQAWGRVTPQGNQVHLEGGLKNAPWYGAIYSLDDWIRSTWSPQQGSLRYETRFREGGFQQDQDMRLGTEEFSVWRRQLKKGEWKEWTTQYPGEIPVHDPLSAMFAMRAHTGTGPWTQRIFSGKETWTLTVTLDEPDEIQTLFGKHTPVTVLRLDTLHRGDIEQNGRFLVYLTDDQRRIPVRVVVKTTLGAIRVDLVEYRAKQAAE